MHLWKPRPCEPQGHVPVERNGVIRWSAPLLLVLYLVSLTVAVMGARAARQAPASWVHGSFATCVRIHESGNGTNHNAGGNLYGVKGTPDSHNNPYSWARGVSRAQQDYIAWRLYVRYGVQPWRPYDGC